MKKRRLSKKGIIIIISSLLLIAAIVTVLILVLQKKPEPEPVKQDEAPKEVKKLKIVDENSKSRPFAVMINNISVARPLQSGLQDAYIVYEIIVEGGITRYMALFLDQNTERIGSIRSARHYYIDYALENDAIYVHHGQSTEALADFSKLGIDRIVVDNSRTGWRDTTLGVSSEHTLFTSIEKLNNGVGNKRKERNKDLLLDYSVDEIDMASLEGAEKADDVSIKYSNATTTSYKYDKDKGYYLRSVNGKEHNDYVTKEQYHAKNIITYQVSNYTLDDGENKGRQELENIGSGTGYFISGGYAVPIKWSKTARDAQTKYTYLNGEEIKVNDGNTFIQIQPKGQTLSITKAQEGDDNVGTN